LGIVVTWLCTAGDSAGPLINEQASVAFPLSQEVLKVFFYSMVLGTGVVPIVLMYIHQLFLKLVFTDRSFNATDPY